MMKKSQQPPLPYRSLAGYLRSIFGEPVRKVPVDPGFGCPNRDGTVGIDGCSFCNPESFVPHYALTGGDPVEQVRNHLKVFPKSRYMIYLQAGTGTYTSPEKFRSMVDRLIVLDGAVGLFVGTRPDCVDGEILDVLTPYSGRKLLFLELGLQSASDATLAAIGRGHDVAAFIRARAEARKKEIPVCAHVILGLPGEDHGDMMETARFLADQGVEGVKMHHLQVIMGTPLAESCIRGELMTFDLDEYSAVAADFLERLRPDTVIHRLAADAPEDLLVAPKWPSRPGVAAKISEKLLTRKSFQGKHFRVGG